MFIHLDDLKIIVCDLDCYIKEIPIALIIKSVGLLSYNLGKIANNEL